MLFDQNILVYLSYLLIIGSWLWISRTQPGLRLRSVGERPEAAFSRGIDVNRTRYLYSLAGWRIGGVGRRHLFSERQAGLEPSPHRGRRLDRAGHRHLWGVESLPSGAGSLSVWRAQVFGQHPATEFSQCSHAGLSGCALCADDCGASPGQRRRSGAYRVLAPGRASTMARSRLRNSAPAGLGKTVRSRLDPPASNPPLF